MGKPWAAELLAGRPAALAAHDDDDGDVHLVNFGAQLDFRMSPLGQRENLMLLFWFTIASLELLARLCNSTFHAYS